MKASEKNRQYISNSQIKTANAKYSSKRSKINLSSVEDYLEYMEEENNFTDQYNY